MVFGWGKGKKQPQGEKFTIAGVDYYLAGPQNKGEFARIYQDKTTLEKKYTDHIHQTFHEIMDSICQFHSIQTVDQHNQVALSIQKLDNQMSTLPKVSMEHLKSGLRQLEKKFSNEKKLKDDYQLNGPLEIHMHDGYHCPSNHDWYFICDNAFQKTGPEENDPFAHWKIHVSANNRTTQQLLADLAMKMGVRQMKFIPQIDRINNKGNKQHGKTAVFYCTEHTADGQKIDWEAFIEKAESIVRSHNTEGSPVRHDRPVPGTEFVYYRYDKDDKGYYMERGKVSMLIDQNHIDTEQGYNPFNKQDPLEWIRIGEANHMRQDELDLLQAVKIGDAKKISVLVEDGANILVRDPASGKNLQEIAADRKAREETLKDNVKTLEISQKVRKKVGELYEQAQEQGLVAFDEIMRIAIKTKNVAPVDAASTVYNVTCTESEKNTLLTLLHNKNYPGEIHHKQKEDGKYVVSIDIDHLGDSVLGDYALQLVYGSLPEEDKKTIGR